MTSTLRLNIFGVGKDDWNCTRKVNKGIEETLLKIFKRRILSDHTTAITSEYAASSDHVQWSGGYPRLLLNTFESHRDQKDLMQYFNRDRVRSYLSSLNHESCDDESFEFDVDYQLRNCIDLLDQLRSHAPSAIKGSCEAARSTTFLQYSDGVPQRIGSYTSDFQAYNSPFSIQLLPPDRRTRYSSSNAPSLPEMFLSLLSGVNKVLRTIECGDHADMSVVESCCLHIDLFLGRKGAGAGFVHDILDDYCSLGYLNLSEGFRASASAISDAFGHVSNIDASCIGDVGDCVSSLGFSFAPCGFLIPYHLGVISLLTDLNVINVTTPLGGASAGALSAVCATSVRPDMRDLMLLTEALSEEAVSRGARYRLDDSLKLALSREVKPGTYLAVNRRIGEITIALASRRLMSYKGHFVSQFTDDSDLCDGIRASCNIPGYSTTGNVMFRGEKCYDGYFATRFRELGCPNTSARRTVRVTPFILGRSFVRRQKLKNEYLYPLLMGNDTYIVHYLRLKSLIRELWKRKFAYEGMGDISAWRSELSLIIAAYEFLVSGKDISNSVTWLDLMIRWRQLGLEYGLKDVKASDDYTPPSISNVDTEEDPELARLFTLVIASEIAHKVGPGSSLSGRNYRGRLEHVDLLKRFGRSGLSPLFSRTNFKTTPYCLIDWLRFEYESTMPRDDRFASSSSSQDLELRTLKQLLHTLLPPLSLSYYYTEFPYLLPNNVGNVWRLTTAMSSCGKADTRYLFDAGRCDGFRWLIGEYISFENWLHLRIRQLEGSARSAASAARVFPGADPDPAKDSYDRPIHARQHDFLSSTVGFLDHEALLKLCGSSDLDKGSSPNSRLLTMQNLLVRRALMLGAVDPHYMHILCYPHLWME